MITTLYAGLLGLLFFKISLDTIKARRRNKISLGSGETDEIIQFVSAHSNFSAYAIFLIILLYFVELSGVIPALIIHLLALSFFIGRVLHYMAFCRGEMNFKLRIRGMKLTLWPLLILSCLNIGVFIYKLF